ncbi:hypothetical protein [Lysinibacillus sp. 38-6]|uniref:hypothetical protein n=1 Tax=Lysinibacillus sp. 38-6 TaxID=3385991 RepID=UPI003908A8AA
MEANFLRITCQRIFKSKKFLWLCVYILILPCIVLRMNDWAVDSNIWNGVFFIFGNRYIYLLLIVPVFLIFLFDLANEGNLRYCAGRLLKKVSIVKVHIKAMILHCLFLTIYVFAVVILEAVYILGGTFNWSEETKWRHDPYTLFSLDLSPIIVISLFAIKFFMTLIFLGSFYLYWQSKTKRQYSSLGMSIILFLLLFNAIVNFYNIPFLNMLDFSFVSIYYLDPHVNSIVLYAIMSHIPLTILSIGLLIFSLYLSKGVNF